MKCQQQSQHVSHLSADKWKLMAAWNGLETFVVLLCLKKHIPVFYNRRWTCLKINMGHKIEAKVMDSVLILEFYDKCNLLAWNIQHTESRVIAATCVWYHHSLSLMKKRWHSILPSTQIGYFFSKKNNRYVKLVLKGRWSIGQSFCKYLDKKLQENSCSLHISEITLRMKLYPQFSRLEKKNDTCVNNKIQ